MSNKLPAIHRITKEQLIDLFYKYIIVVESSTGEDWISHYDCKEYGMTDFEIEVLQTIAKGE